MNLKTRYLEWENRAGQRMLRWMLDNRGDGTTMMWYWIVASIVVVWMFTNGYTVR